MVKIAIYGQIMPVVCHNKKGCPVVSIDHLMAMKTSNDEKPYRTIGDFDPITKEWS